MKILLTLMVSIILQILFLSINKIANFFLKPRNQFSDENLMKCNPLTLIYERYISGDYLETIYTNPQHLQGEILYKAIYFALNADEKFTEIIGHRTVVIEGLTPTQRLTLSLKFNLHYYHCLDMNLFMDIVKDNIVLTNYDEHVNCIIIKYKKIEKHLYYTHHISFYILIFKEVLVKYVTPVSTIPTHPKKF